MSRRERGKEQRRDGILLAAERLFAGRGYADTTMEAIADRASVGVATVYKYFGTKAAIVEGIIRPSLETAFGAAEQVIASPPADPGLAMSELLDKYRLLRNDWADRHLLRALSLLITDSDGVLAPLVRESNVRCQRQIRDLLLVMKVRGDIAPDLNLDDASMVVFCVFNQHYEMFVTHPDVSAERLFADLGRRARLLFDRWVTV